MKGLKQRAAINQSIDPKSGPEGDSGRLYQGDHQGVIRSIEQGLEQSALVEKDIIEALDKVLEKEKQLDKKIGFLEHMELTSSSSRPRIVSQRPPPIDRSRKGSMYALHSRPPSHSRAPSTTRIMPSSSSRRPLGSRRGSRKELLNSINKLQYQ